MRIWYFMHGNIYRYSICRKMWTWALVLFMADRDGNRMVEPSVIYCA